MGKVYHTFCQRLVLNACENCEHFWDARSETGAFLESIKNTFLAKIAQSTAVCIWFAAVLTPLIKIHCPKNPPYHYGRDSGSPHVKQVSSVAGFCRISGVYFVIKRPSKVYMRRGAVWGFVGASVRKMRRK